MGSEHLAFGEPPLENSDGAEQKLGPPKRSLEASSESQKYPETSGYRFWALLGPL